MVYSVNAQKQANYWYFGDYAGISFAMGPPAALSNGALSTGEGCSSISTALGALEFYTDGRFVYNKNHQQMPNGSGLLGNSSSTQSGIIVPKPLSTTEYYIFTVDAYENQLVNGLCYSKVDMTLNNGLGDVVPDEKNISLCPLSCEKVTAVGHHDGYTFWVITKKWGNSDFYAYRITPDGVLTTPVISTTGPPVSGDMQHSKGYIKVSPDGNWIAIANNTQFDVGIYHFDHATGIVTHVVTDESYTSPGGWDPGGPYGVEFSPNSKALYISEWKGNRKIHQYDLSSGIAETILASNTVVASVGQSADPIGSLQLGPDNRLYIARQNSPYLSRINLPNVIGTNCNFVDNAVNLAGRNSTYGLPPFIQSFFYLSADFYWDEPACTGYTTNFFTSASDNPDSVKWTFPGGVVSTSLDPTFHFTTPGMYGVQLVVYLYGQSKLVSHIVRVGTTPTFELGNDSIICASEAFFLDAGNYTSYYWQDSTTSQTNLTDTTGWYWCRITNESGCPNTDSLYMIVNPNPEVDAGPDKTIPEGTTTILEGSVVVPGDYSYHWEPAAFLVNANVLHPVTVALVATKIFTLTVTNNATGCTGEDVVTVNVTGGPLGCIPSASPTNICKGDQSQLNVIAYGGNGPYTYSWTSNPAGFTSTYPEPVVQPTQTTIYYITVSDGETSISGNVTINVNQPPVPNAGSNQTITYGTSTILHGNSTGTGPFLYQWEPSDKLVSSNVQNPTTVNLYASTVFTLSITDLGTGCVSESDGSVSVILEGNALAAAPSAEPDITCAGGAVHLFALASGGTSNYTYSWSSTPPGFTSNLPEPVVNPTATTKYTVTVNDGYNSATGNTTVTVNELPIIDLLPVDPKVQILSPTEIGVCVFDSVTLNAGNTGATYYWSNGSVDQTINIQTSGITFDFQEYDVTVTNPNTGCSEDAHISVFFTFTNCSYGMGENDSESGIKIYPNPSADGHYNFTFEQGQGDITLEVFSSQGTILQKEVISNINGAYQSSLILSNTSPGIYLLKITGENNSYLRKLIIHQ